jgi:hypothetical protein
MNSRSRLSDLRRFYMLLDGLAQRTGGPQRLLDSSGRMDWPRRGVYFFMESGEVRRESGEGARIVRVGTHALTAGSRSTLWGRLSQHKGQQRTEGGNHRGSIFRLLVGATLLADDPLLSTTWGQGKTAAGAAREAERDLEYKVSAIIRQMPFLVLPADDEPGSQSLRGHIERNSIALLSNAGKATLDAPSVGWLGNRCPRVRVTTSGLWNQNHVDEDYDPAFLDVLERVIQTVERRG